MRRPPIQTIADKILALLSHCDTEPIFAKFCQELKLLESPIRTQTITQGAMHYVLPELGVSIFSTDTRLLSASFYIQPAQLEDITTLPYCNELPFGLKTDHKIDNVHALLGPPDKTTKPCGLGAEKYHDSESYSRKPWEIILWYQRPNQQLAELIVCRHQAHSEVDQ